MKSFKKDLTNAKLNIKLNESLRDHTTYKVGGYAKFFVVVNNILELRKFLEIAKKHKQNFFILGAGSKLLVSDFGVKIVLKLGAEFNNFVIKKNIVRSGAGVKLIKLSNEVSKSGLSGMEELSGIPATIGGAIYMNAGAFGNCISKHLIKVLAIDHLGNLKTFYKKDCNFGYRTSIFKNNKYIILFAEFKLKSSQIDKIMPLIAQIRAKRAKNNPKGNCCGSVFKKTENYSAGYLIDKCGLKGAKCGYAEISSIHANFILNTNKAKAKHIKKLIKICKKKVFKKFKIKLEEELIFVK